MHLTLFDKIKRFIKLLYSCPNYIKIIKKINKNDGKRAILVGTPVHGNLGDHLIANESLKYLRKFNFTDIIEVPEILYELFYKKIKFSENDIIFISGGGWMGSLYYDEVIIEDIIKRWPDNSIIILPQTVSFAGGNFSSPDNLKQILNNHKKLLITVRDEKSYEVCVDLLGVNKNRVLLLPDMALISLNKIENNLNKDNTILFSIRNDREKNTNLDVEKLKKELESEKLDVIFSSSVIKNKAIKIRQRDKFLKNKINEFSKSKLIITDRLHSMVFSILAGTKCIAIDNSTHKVVGVYKKWLYDVNALWVVEDANKLNIDYIRNVLKNNTIMNEKEYNDVLKPLDEKIGELL